MYIYLSIYLSIFYNSLDQFLLCCFYNLCFVLFLCSFRVSGPGFRVQIRNHEERVVSKKCKLTDLKGKNCLNLNFKVLDMIRGQVHVLNAVLHCFALWPLGWCYFE